MPTPDDLLFDAAACWIGMDASIASFETLRSRFGGRAALILYGLYQRVKAGRCYSPTKTAESPFEMRLNLCWCSFANMSSATARQLFTKSVKLLDPRWYTVQNYMLELIANTHLLDPNLYSTSQGSIAELIMNAQTRKKELESKFDSAMLDLSGIPVSKTISRESGSTMEAKGEVSESSDLGSICAYDKWIKLTVHGELPMPRYEHGSAIIQDKMYVFGGSHYGCYLNDLKITWNDCILSVGGLTKASRVGGLTKVSRGTITVTEFDINSSTWRNLEAYGKAPVSRRGQSVTLIGSQLVIFGGEDAMLSYLNDLHILDLDTKTWIACDDMPSSPCPRAHHIAACHANQFLFIFGGNNEYTMFNDLYIFDMKTRKWSRPEQRGAIPGLRLCPAGVTIGDNWFIAGGWDHQKDFSETLMLNMPTLVWSVVTSVELSSSVAKEGLSLVSVMSKGEEFLVAFGGLYGDLSNEVNVLRPSYKQHIDPLLATRNASRDDEPLAESLLDEWIRNIWLCGTQLSTSNNERSKGVEACLKPKKEPKIDEPESSTLHGKVLQNDHPLLPEHTRCFKEEKPKLHMSAYGEASVPLMPLSSSKTERVGLQRIPPTLSALISDFENQLRNLSTERPKSAASESVHVDHPSEEIAPPTFSHESTGISNTAESARGIMSLSSTARVGLQRIPPALSAIISEFDNQLRNLSTKRSKSAALESEHVDLPSEDIESTRISGAPESAKGVGRESESTGVGVDGDWDSTEAEADGEWEFTDVEADMEWESTEVEGGEWESTEVGGEWEYTEVEGGEWESTEEWESTRGGLLKRMRLA